MPPAPSLASAVAAVLSTIIGYPLRRVQLVLQTRPELEGELPQVWKQYPDFAYWGGGLRYRCASRAIGALTRGLNHYAIFFATYPLSVAEARASCHPGRAIPGEALTACARRGALFDGLPAGIAAMAVHRVGYAALYATVAVVKDRFQITDRVCVTILATAVMVGASAIAYPFASVSRRMMAQAGLEKEGQEEGEQLYSSSLDCARRVAKEEGVVGFYRGLDFEAFTGVCAMTVALVPMALASQRPARE